MRTSVLGGLELWYFGGTFVSGVYGTRPFVSRIYQYVGPPEDALLLLFMIELLCHTEAGCFKADRQFGCDFITKRAACKESEVKAEGQETGESNEGSGE